MSEKLHELCQLQLSSIVTDLEKSVDGVNSAASRIMQTVNSNLQSEDISGDSVKDLSGIVGNEVKNIIVGLQFHDELTQRLQHLQTLLHLLEESPAGKNGSEDNEKLLSRLKNIFSSNAEFNQLEKVFPGCKVVSSTEAIELF